MCIRDSITTYQNGLGATLPELGAGFYFDESNDVMSGGKNSTCFECTSIEDQHGFVVRDSIDLQLLSVDIRDSVNAPALDIDNTGMDHDGTVIMDDIKINLNSTGHSVKLDEVDGLVRNLDMNGANGGLRWDASGQEPSYLENSVIRGNTASCFDMVDHSELFGHNVAMACDSGAPASTSSSFVNLTGSWFSSGFDRSGLLKLERLKHFVRIISRSDFNMVFFSIIFEA